MRSTRNSILYQTYPTETPVLDVIGYFNEYKNLLYPIDVLRGKNIFENKKSEYDFYAKVLGISCEDVKELNETTGIHNLDCPGEIEPVNHKLHDSHADFQMKYEIAQLTKDRSHSLVSVKKRLEVQGELYPSYNFKYGQYAWLPEEEFINVKQDLNPFNFSTIVFCVKVYHPYLSYSSKGHRIKLLQEIHLLGDQSLSDLKDKILCTMDYTGINDVSNCIVKKKDETELNKREEYLSSFIFIENQFFNDTRVKCMRDLSQTIINWANGKQLGPFTTGQMENTKMKDIKLRIGRPYVYQHQGDCEHVLIISDIRFLQFDDPLKMCSFPRVFAKGRCSAKYCMMCGVSYARWLVTGNMRLTHDKSYFCNRCFKSYNYIDGKKIGKFKAFEYIDPIALM